MDGDKSDYPIIDNKSSHKNKEIVPMRNVDVKRIYKTQIFKRRPIVINNKGSRIWEVECDRYYYRDKLTNKWHSCSFYFDGDMLIVCNHKKEIIEAYKLKEGEHVITVWGE